MAWTSGHQKRFDVLMSMLMSTTFPEVEHYRTSIDVHFNKKFLEVTRQRQQPQQHGWRQRAAEHRTKYSFKKFVENLMS